MKELDEKVPKFYFHPLGAEFSPWTKSEVRARAHGHGQPMSLMKCFFFDFSDSVSAIAVPALPSLLKSIQYWSVSDDIVYFTAFQHNSDRALFKSVVRVPSSIHTVLIILCGRQRLWTEGFIESRSLWYLVYQYLFSQASRLRLLLVRCSSEDVVELSQRYSISTSLAYGPDNLPFEENCIHSGFATDYLQC